MSFEEAIETCEHPLDQLAEQLGTSVKTTGSLDPLGPVSAAVACEMQR